MDLKKKKIAAKAQMPLLEWKPNAPAAAIWHSLDEAARSEVVTLLAAMACASVMRRRVKKEPHDEP